MEYEDWIKAGKITAEALQFGKDMIKPGVKLLDVAVAVEQKMIDLGGAPAFPVNISLNSIAAHYTPSVNDEKVFNDEVVKLDVGAMVEGAIGDAAVTVDLSGKYTDMMKAAEDALDAALKISVPGMALGKIGKEIEDAIKSHGFVPIRNLSGHSLELNDLHSGITIPNYDSGEETKLEEGQRFAIEPFATDGAGKVNDSANPEIFSVVQPKPVRSQASRGLLKQAQVFQGLPFAKRWIEMPLFKLNFAIRELCNLKVLHEYPPLVEANKGIITQAEHTIIVKDKPVITTKF
jgi:methionyl aminopeptidase